MAFIFVLGFTLGAVVVTLIVRFFPREGDVLGFVARRGEVTSLQLAEKFGLSVNETARSLADRLMLERQEVHGAGHSTTIYYRWKQEAWLKRSDQ